MISWGIIIVIVIGLFAIAGIANSHANKMSAEFAALREQLKHKGSDGDESNLLFAAERSADTLHRMEYEQEKFQKVLLKALNSIDTSLMQIQSDIKDVNTSLDLIETSISELTSKPLA